VKLVSTAGEPDTAAVSQGLGLLQLAQTEQPAVEAARRILAARRRGDLDVVETLNQGYLTWTPEIAREMTRRWISEVPSKIV
jgi:hypothetical protein